MINLNNFTEEEKEVKIFNNGQAGRVTDVGVSIVRKQPDDNPNSPDYKVLYTDSTGATVNDAIYYPKDSDSDSQKRIAMSRLVGLLHAINPDSKTKDLPEFEDYKPAVDFLVKQIIASAKTGAKVNVFVCYGTRNNPSQYLRVRKFNFVESASVSEDRTRLKPKFSMDEEKKQWDDMMERVQPTSFDDSPSVEDTSDAGLDDW